MQIAITNNRIGSIERYEFPYSALPSDELKEKLSSFIGGNVKITFSKGRKLIEVEGILADVEVFTKHKLGSGMLPSYNLVYLKLKDEPNCLYVDGTGEDLLKAHNENNPYGLKPVGLLKKVELAKIA